jgi:hypothetical protein
MKRGWAWAAALLLIGLVAIVLGLRRVVGVLRSSDLEPAAVEERSHSLERRVLSAEPWTERANEEVGQTAEVRAVAVVVVLRDLDARALAEGVEISIARLGSGEIVHRSRATADKIEIENLAAGHYEVHGDAPGYAPARELLELATYHERFEVFLEFRPAMTVEGIVKTASGDPVAGAEVVAANYDEKIASTKSGEDGRFHLSQLDIRGVEIVALDPRYGVAKSKASADRPGSIELELVFDATQRYRGTVSSANGPIQGARIYEPMDRPFERLLRATSDAGGRFEFEATRSLGFMIASAAGYVEIQEIAIDGRFEFVLEEGGVWFGVVLSHQGRPVEGASLEATCGMRSLTPARTDREGRFRFEGVPTGGCDLTISHRDHPTLKVHEDEASGERSYRLDPASTLVLRVVDEEERPVPHFYWSLEGAGVRRSKSDSNPEGRSELGALPEGTYVLVVNSTRYLPTKIDRVVIGRGTIEELRVVMKSGGSIHGKVVGLSVRDEKYVAAFDSNGRLADRSHVLDDFAFVVSKLEPGRYELQLFDGDPSASTSTKIGRAVTVVLDGPFVNDVVLTAE